MSFAAPALLAAPCLGSVPVQGGVRQAVGSPSMSHGRPVPVLESAGRPLFSLCASAPSLQDHCSTPSVVLSPEPPGVTDRPARGSSTCLGCSAEPRELRLGSDPLCAGGLTTTLESLPLSRLAQRPGSTSTASSLDALCFALPARHRGFRGDAVSSLGPCHAQRRGLFFHFAAPHEPHDLTFEGQGLGRCGGPVAIN